MDKDSNDHLIVFKSVSAAKLKNFSFLLKKQAINYLLGPNASGKSILAHQFLLFRINNKELYNISILY